MNSEKYIGRSSSNHRGRGDGFHREFNHGIHPRDGSGDDSSVLYYTRNRAQWLAKLREAGVRRRAERLYEQLDMLRHLRQQARRELLAESRKHAITAKLRQIPYLAPIRSALAVALMQTPHRSAPSDNCGPTADWRSRPASARNIAWSKVKYDARRNCFAFED